jgi:hypothetical protein
MHAHLLLIFDPYDALHRNRCLTEDLIRAHPGSLNKPLEGNIMKSLIRTAAAALILTLPIAAFAQTNGPVTRADVRAQLVQLEDAGYNPASDHATYPAKLEAAQARLNQHGTDAYGGVADSASQSGTAFHPQYDVGLKSIYTGH